MWLLLKNHNENNGFARCRQMSWFTVRGAKINSAKIKRQRNYWRSLLLNNNKGLQRNSAAPEIIRELTPRINFPKSPNG